MVLIYWHSDIPGFSQIDQNHLSHLVSHHRRKLRADAKNDVLKVGGSHLLYLCLLLRLAVLLNHSRVVIRCFLPLN